MSITQHVPATRVGLPSDHRVGQATAVEQSRAVAEVQAAIVMAQQLPRSAARAIASLEEACGQMALAERAQFRFPRGGQNLTGPTIALAKQVALSWGNIQHGVSELRRDDVHGQSEMQAWAWDLETNTRASTTFIVPHKRDKRGGAEALTDTRDIYENNANNGARRLREQIFSVVPTWFVEKAKALCAATLEHGGGLPLAERVAKAVRMFSDLGVTLVQLESKLNRKRDQWTAPDVATLSVIFTSLQQGTVTVAEEFPASRVTAEEIQSAPTPKTKRQTRRLAVAEDLPVDEDEPEPGEPPVDPYADERGEDGWIPRTEPGSGGGSR